MKKPEAEWLNVPTDAADFINGQHQGGCDDLYRLDKLGQLDSLLPLTRLVVEVSLPALTIRRIWFIDDG